MRKFRITACYEDGKRDSMIIDALDKDDALQYAMCVWGDCEDFYAEEVNE